MAIDTKEIQVYLWRFVKFSLHKTCLFVQKYPVFSGVSLFLFGLYMFFPSVFYFLVYSSPFIACTAVFFRFYGKTTNPYTPNVVKHKKDHATSSENSIYSAAALVASRGVKKDDEILSAETEAGLAHLVRNIDGHSSEHAETSLLENIEDKNMEMENLETMNGGDKLGIVFSNHDVSIGEKMEALGETSNFNPMSLDDIDKKATESNLRGQGELESSSSEDDNEDKPAQGQMNNALEWTEDDQKNLMDLGMSEEERNRRLENLIARRRARKYFRLIAQRHVPSLEKPPSASLAPVFVARSNLFDVPSSSQEQIPGSAPSIMLPNRNPFDIPYDPLEEKPNLLGGSFHEEFMMAHQKGLIFCRHESFSSGLAFPLQGLHTQHAEHASSQEGQTLRRTLSITDLVTEDCQSSNQVVDKPENGGETGDSKAIKTAYDTDSSLDNKPGTQIGREAIRHRHSNSESSQASSVEDNEEIFNGKRPGGSETAFRFPEVFSDNAQISLSCPVPRARATIDPSDDTSPSMLDRVRMQNHLLYTNTEPWHTPTQSIASDMQVEVSEVGSPPLTIDGSASSSGGESLTYDGDIEKEITSGSDEMWGISPHAPKVVEEHFLSFTEPNESNIVEGSSYDDKEATGPFGSSLCVSPSSGTETSQESQSHSTNFTHNISKDVRREVEAEKVVPSSPSDTFQPETKLHDTPLTVQSPNEAHLLEPLETHASTEESSQELNSRNTVEVPVLSYNDVKDSNSNEDGVGGAEKSITHDIVVPSKSNGNEESSYESSMYTESNHDRPTTSQTISNSVAPTEERNNSKSVDKTEEDSVENEHHGNVNISEPVQAEDNLMSSKQYIVEAQTAAEVGVPETNSINNGPGATILPAMQEEIVMDQVSTHSSASSSPKSVLTKRIPAHDSSFSDLNQSMQTDLSESDMDNNIERTREQFGGNSVMTEYRDLGRAENDSSGHPSTINNYVGAPEELRQPHQNTQDPVPNELTSDNKIKLDEVNPVTQNRTFVLEENNLEHLEAKAEHSITDTREQGLENSLFLTVVESHNPHQHTQSSVANAESSTLNSMEHKLEENPSYAVEELTDPNQHMQDSVANEVISNGKVNSDEHDLVTKGQTSVTVSKDDISEQSKTNAETDTIETVEHVQDSIGHEVNSNDRMNSDEHDHVIQDQTSVRKEDSLEKSNGNTGPDTIETPEQKSEKFASQMSQESHVPHQHIQNSESNELTNNGSIVSFKHDQTSATKRETLEPLKDSAESDMEGTMGHTLESLLPPTEEELHAPNHDVQNSVTNRNDKIKSNENAEKQMSSINEEILEGEIENSDTV